MRIYDLHFYKAVLYGSLKLRYPITSRASVLRPRGAAPAGARAASYGKVAVAYIPLREPAPRAARRGARRGATTVRRSDASRASVVHGLWVQVVGTL